MKVVFLQSSAVDESLSLCDAAARLAADGHQVGLVLSGHEADPRRSIAALEPEVVVLQAAFMAEGWLLSAMEWLPSSSHSILVGTAATFDSDLLARIPADAALRGEIDESLPAYLRALQRGEDRAGLAAVVTRSEDGSLYFGPSAPSPEALDEAPLPLRSIYFDAYPFMGRFPWKRFVTGRGCVHSCGFCYLPGLRQLAGDEKARVRRKSVSRVIEEVQSVRRRWPLRRIHFADDLFAPNEAWLEEFASRFSKEVGLPFSCNTSPETVTQRRAALLRRAGAEVVGIGLETADEEVRAGILGRPTPNTVIERAASRLKTQGIELLTFNMLGMPGEALEQAIATVAMNQRLGTRYPRVNLAYPSPGSVVDRQMRKKGLKPPPPSAYQRNEQRAWCVEDGAPFEAISRLFRLGIRRGWSPTFLERIARLRPGPMLRPLVLYDAAVEWRWSGVSLLDALRYARHAGTPNARVTYHESLL